MQPARTDLEAANDNHPAETAKGAGAQMPGLPTVAKHVVAGAATLTGAVSGAGVGAVAGPAGAAIGSAIGAGIGALVGHVLEREDQRTMRHDHELDNAIGVTDGDLGAHEPAVHGMNLAGPPAVEDDRIALVAALLRREHQRLYAIYDKILVAYEQKDWARIRKLWSVLEPAMRGHLKAEEKYVFSAFEQLDPAEAAALKGEHDQLRDRLAELAIRIELHVFPRQEMKELIDRARAHAEREHALLYPWMANQIGT
jgi:hypothetical protein